MHPPTRNRLRKRPKPLRLHFSQPAPGVFGVDVGEAMFQQMAREFLESRGLLGDA